MKMPLSFSQNLLSHNSKHAFSHFRSMRIRIMGNIGACFIKLRQFNDAVSSYEHIMNEHPDFKPGFNLVLCYYALQGMT